jgi:hypothetical protein
VELHGFELSTSYVGVKKGWREKEKMIHRGGKRYA